MGTDQDAQFWIQPLEDDRLQNFFMALSGMILFIVVAIILWKCCFKDEEESNTIKLPKSQNYPITPVYARELEPGLVVLQSQDGEFFRILQECDSKQNNSNLSSGGACADPTTSNSSVQYIPQYTRPYYQNSPSAPPVSTGDSLIDLRSTSSSVPPPYSQY